MKPFVLGLFCAALTACAIPLPGPPKEPKPASTIRDTVAVTPRDGAGAIVITRDIQLQGMSCVHDVYLDDQPVAELRNGEQVTMYADPGPRIVTVSIRPEGSCKTAVARFPLQVVASATTRVRDKADGYYGLKIEATTY